MSTQEELKSTIKKLLPDVKCVIGWGCSDDALRAAPLFMRKEADVDNFTAGYFSVNNLALYLPEYKDSKVAIVAKGCDVRSIGELIAEGLIKRENVHIIAFPCKGVIDTDKVRAHLAGRCELDEVKAVRIDGDSIVLDTPVGKIVLAKNDVTADKCLRCVYPDAPFYDTFVGEKSETNVEDNFDDLVAFEALSMAERFDFWEKEMSRCTRCYACRNACPMCVCKDHCVALSRSPHWISQADGVRDKMFFQIIHATHLAGRCTGCGECQRACPMGIPVGLFKRALERQVIRLFDHKSGIDPEEKLPLLTFALEEPVIKERSW